MTFANVVFIAMGAVVLGAAAMIQVPTKGSSLPLRLFHDAHPADFVGEAKCAKCHTDTAANFTKSAHAIYMHGPGLTPDKQGCEGCHGPGAVHLREKDPQIIDYAKISPKEVADACLRCHGDLIQKPHWRSEAHARAGVSCVSCHQIHPQVPGDNPAAGDRGIVKKQIFAATRNSNPLLKADEPTLCNRCHQLEVAQFRLNSHHPIPEGRMLCSDCHTIHPTRGDGLKVVNVKQQCASCHAQVAGPFVYEHDPVAGWMGGGCIDCHKPHGSNNPTLLNPFSRSLCNQCHTDKAASHHPGQSCWSSGCHVAIHGSNTSPQLLSR